MTDSGEEAGEKTEQPNERQRQKSKQEGQVPRSRDMMAALHSLFVFLFLAMSQALAVFTIFDGYSDLLANTGSNPQWLIEATRVNFALFPRLFLSLLLVVLVSCLLGAFVSGPLIFSLKVPAFKAQRISPLQGLKKIFSTKGLAEVVKSLAKSILLLGALYALLSINFDKIMALGGYTVPVAARHGLNLLLLFGVCLSFMLLLVAVPDVFWQKYRFTKDQMQTRQQAKESQKNEEGSPQSRQRLRRMQRQQASVNRKKMLDSVPDADLIITNPEHFAVALQYAPKKNSAPVVIAKGIDFLAQMITEKARQQGKPVLIQPMLTRAIYYHTDVGQEISPDLYNAVARIMVYLYQLDQYRKERLSAPPRPPAINVPAQYDYLKNLH